MVRQDILERSTAHNNGVLTRFLPDGGDLEVVAEPLHQNPVLDWTIDDDFLYDALSAVTDTPYWNTYLNAAAGTPAIALTADAAGGQVTLTLANNNEAEVFALTQGNNLFIDMSKPFSLRARVKLPSVTTAQTVVIGVASDGEATLDDVTRNAWFRLAASLDLLTESDDNATNTDDQDTGIDLTASTWYWFSVQKRENGDLEFYLADGDGQNRRRVAKHTGLAYSGNGQPFLGIAKSTGTTTPAIAIDRVIVTGRRAA